MGKSEHQRFRRKAKGQSSSSVPVSNSLISPPSTVDNLLCTNLLEKTSELSSEGHTAANGTCDIEAGDGDLAAAALAPQEDSNTLKDFSLSSHLPTELSELFHSEITPLCSSQSLHLSACYVQKEDSLILVIFITNSSDFAVQEVLVDLDSEQLEVIHSFENNE